MAERRGAHCGLHVAPEGLNLASNKSSKALELLGMIRLEVLSTVHIVNDVGVHVEVCLQFHETNCKRMNGGAHTMTAVRTEPLSAE